LNVVNALLHGGADHNAKGRNERTALLLAIEEEHQAIADVLLSQPNIDLKAETLQGMTPLMVAVWHQQEPTVRTLLKLGADVNHQDKEGDTAVHGAAFYGNTKILYLLLNAKANPNLQNRLGGTALMWAASYGHDEIVGMLLSKGADAKIRDVDGVTAAGWAAKNGRSNLEILLRAAEKAGSSRP
jgi:ankyrin repeat protein